MKIWFDGEVRDLSDASISPLDHGITVGDGVFETLVVRDRRPFAWRRHHERLAESAGELGITAPPETHLRAGVDDLVAATGLSEGRLRVTITAGAGPPGSAAPDGPCVAFMVLTPLAPAAPSAAVVVTPWTRSPNDPCAGLKTISYAGNVRALAYAHARGASEALFENTDGHLCEATGSNVFIVVEGALRTPPISAGCLGGVTRALICELAPDLGIPCAEIDVTLDDLMGADEAFLSSTTRNVQPIESVDGVSLASTGGPVSRRLADGFAALVARDDDP